MSISLPNYGFDSPDFVQSDTFAEFQKEYDIVLKRRYERWKRVINQGDLVLKRFCRKGIPSEFRSHVWMNLSGADKEMKENPNVYKSASGLQPAKEFNTTILAGALYNSSVYVTFTCSNPNQHLFFADLPRTFPENVNFSAAAGLQNKRHSLQRVLQAFAITFPKIGYCQVSAALLLVHMAVRLGRGLQRLALFVGQTLFVLNL
ncbi:unnamed protein product [Schistocephalus solidus]|uniref:Rab-GAP TBC domain-containing protein n=1 Tax=Schistocephalus solidus TaxID=70667 RepID=A0A183SMB6_SCHSO|nr:unnamed protein product [Schistocephalus solidus]